MIRFYRDTQDYPVQLDLNDPQTIYNMQPDHGKPWKLLIHGYTGSRNYTPNTEIRPGKKIWILGKIGKHFLRFITSYSPFKTPNASFYL